MSLKRTIFKKKTFPKIMKKTWGYEFIFENNSKYCGKLIHIRKDEFSSNGKYHYHKIKDETFFVIKGKLRVMYFEDSMSKFVTLKRGDSLRIISEMPHRFTSLTKYCEFIEVSTHHDDSDSYYLR